MPLKARAEARLRLVGRRIDIRRRLEVERRRTFTEAFWGAIDDYYARKSETLRALFHAIWSTDRQYYESRDPWFRQFARAFWEEIDEYYRRRALPLLMAYALVTWGYAYYQGRAAFVYVYMNEHGKWVFVSDTRKELRVLENIPRAEWARFARLVEENISRKGTLLVDLPPNLYALLQHYVGLYRNEPCHHLNADFKITPWAMLTLRYKPMYGYTIRWAYKNEISDTDTVRRTQPMDLRVQPSLRYKPRYRLFKGKIPAVDSEELKETDKTNMGRDGLNRPTLGIPLSHAMFMPHLMKKEFARNIGMAEAHLNVGHCSLFAVPRERARKSLKNDEFRLRKISHHYVLDRMLQGREAFWQAKYHSLPFLPDELFEDPHV